MANRTFDLNIDVTKIDKKKIYEGKKGKYYKVRVVLKDELDQFGNTGFVQTASTKEEREQGYEASFLGNLKEFIFNKKEEESSDDLF